MTSSRRRARGAVRLGAFLKSRDVSYRDAGKALGVSGTMVWHWVHGQKLPTESRCQDIETWTGGDVPFEAWGVERTVVKPWSAQAPTGASRESG